MSLNNLISPIKDSINCKATLQDILDAMIENHTKHFVLIENKKPVGIITERDILLLYTNHVNLNLKAINYAKKPNKCKIKSKNKLYFRTYAKS